MYYSLSEYSDNYFYYSRYFCNPGSGSYIACNLALLLSYLIYEFTIFTLACILFTPWFALKTKSINLRFIYLLTVLLLCRAVTVFQITSSYDVQYTIHQNYPWFLLIELFCWGLLLYVIYGLIKELKTKKKDMLISRILILIGLVYITFSTFNSRRKMIQIIQTGKVTAAEKYENGIDRRNFKYLQYLVSNGVDINARYDVSKKTPLMDAVRYPGNLEVVKFMFNNGADISLRDRNGNTVLLMAVFAQKLNVVEFLLANGADINSRNNDGLAPLSIAEKQGFSAMIKLLKKHGAKLDKKELYNIEFLSVFSHPNKNLAKIRKYLNDGANPNYKFIKGSTPLINAVKKEKKDLIDLLLKHKADVNLCDNDGRVPLSYAHTVEIAQDLINAGADINAIDREGNSLLMFGYRENIPQLLLKKGIDVNAKNNEGSTALHIAVDCYSLNFKLLDLLLSNGADPNAQNKEGQTPLMVMYFQEGMSNNKVIDLFAKHGADFNIQDNAGRTLLFELLFNYYYGFEPMFYLLERYPVDVSIKDKLGNTVLDYARLRERTRPSTKEVIEAIEKASKK